MEKHVLDSFELLRPFERDNESAFKLLNPIRPLIAASGNLGSLLYAPFSYPISSSICPLVHF